LSKARYQTKQLLNSQHSAAADRQQSLCYQLYADIVNTTHTAIRVQQTAGQKNKKTKTLLVININL
jgi:hypothetical protein